MAYTLPDLPYAFNALEPVIDRATMELHHDKHHASYVKKLNAAVEGQEEFADTPIDELMRSINDVPEDIRQAVINNGGGHANHSLFWRIMTPGGSDLPAGAFADAVIETFGSLDELQAQVSDAATSQFGSGWGWLVLADGTLEVIATKNQDSPLMDDKTPLVGIDVWEHAYYLKYQNRRPDYVRAWWDVVNWPEVAGRYDAAMNA